MGLSACKDPNALNFNFDAQGNFVPEAPLNDLTICEYESGSDADEEQLAESIGSEDFTTQEEAEIRGSVPTTDRERNRSAYIRGQESTKTPFLGLGILAYILMS